MALSSRLRWLALISTIITGIVLGSSVASQTNPLEDAIQAQDWPRAIQILDIMIEREPDNQELKNYREKLEVLRERSTAPAPPTPPPTRPPQSPSQLIPEPVPNSAEAGMPEPEIPEMPLGLGNYRYSERDGGYETLLQKPFNGTPVVWTRYPVLIRVENGSDHWESAVRDALKSWNRYIPNRVLVSSQETEDILIKPAEGFGVRGLLGQAYHSDYYFDEEGKLRHRVTLDITDPQNISPFAIDGFFRNQMESIALHELGHAFGILGHSNEEKDLMYPSLDSRLKVIKEISRGDLNTLYQLYQQPTYIGVVFPPELRNQVTIIELQKQ
ncbi:MAG: matrixin family metalloprotease [Synechococcaceae cyanobacterium SM2_3_1]|nr:matrixin family metalloprotease [Synechococcaceae cyanobacterium SM2_3_1]